MTLYGQVKPRTVSIFTDLSEHNTVDASPASKDPPVLATDLFH